MHYQDPFRIRVRSAELYQKREMRVPSMERGAYSLCQETVLEIDAAMILVSGRLRETTCSEAPPSPHMRPQEKPLPTTRFRNLSQCPYELGLCRHCHFFPQSSLTVDNTILDHTSPVRWLLGKHAWIPWRFSRCRYSGRGWRSRASRSARNTLSKD